MTRTSSTMAQTAHTGYALAHDSWAIAFPKADTTPTIAAQPAPE